MGGGETMGSMYMGPPTSRIVFWENMEETYGFVCRGNFPPDDSLWCLYKSTQKYPDVVREQMLEKDETLKRLTSEVQHAEATLKNGTYPNSGRALTDKARKALEKSLQSNTPLMRSSNESEL